MTQADIKPRISNEIRDKYAEAIEQLNAFLHGGIASAYPPSRFEDLYKELQGLKGFFDTVNWDKIIRESGEMWIGDLRKDAAFKEYYKLRSEIDRLGVLVK